MLRKVISEVYRILWRAPLRAIYGGSYELRIYDNQLFRAALFIERHLRNYYLRTLNLKSFRLALLKTPYGLALSLNDEGSLYCAYEIFLENVYEKFLPIEKEDIVVDIGAHVGFFTLKAARVSRHVLAFEPHPLNYTLLALNTKINHLNNVTPVNVALADYSGHAKLYLGRFSGSHTIIEKRVKDKNAYIMVKVDTLDNLIKQFKLEEPLFIKIDVEGAELDVLRGAKKILSNDYACVKLAIASYHTPDEAFKLSNYLINFGFKVYLWRHERVTPFIYAIKGRYRA